MGTGPLKKPIGSVGVGADPGLQGVDRGSSPIVRSTQDRCVGTCTSGALKVGVSGAPGSKPPTPAKGKGGR